MIENKICSNPKCASLHSKKGKYCCQACYLSVPKSSETRAKMSSYQKGRAKPEGFGAKVSAGLTGKPKPWQQGKNNVNFGNKAQNKVRDKFLAASKARGLAWDDDEKKRHSLRMLGSSNAMRGKSHTAESKLRMSTTKKELYRLGLVNIRAGNTSGYEEKIASWLRLNDIQFIPQYHIEGLPFRFDFYLPDHKTVVEFQGDYWHANPNKYTAGTKIKIRNVGEVDVETLWEKDNNKKTMAEDKGYRVICFWESDFKKYGVEYLNELLNAKM